MSDWMPGVPQFKEPKGSSKVTRAKKRLDAKRLEDGNKKTVRIRDKRCRFPLCGCGKFKLRTVVAHLEHKGMGGNPAGDRSTTEKLIYLCVMRHQDSKWSHHHGTIRCLPLTGAGTDGPVAWEVFLLGGWIEVAREKSIGVLEPLHGQQKTTLREMAEMSC